MDYSPPLGNSQHLSDIESVAGMRTYGSSTMSSPDIKSSRTSIEPVPVSYRYSGSHSTVSSALQTRGTGNNMSVYAMLSPSPSYAGQNFGR